MGFGISEAHFILFVFKKLVFSFRAIWSLYPDFLKSVKCYQLNFSFFYLS
jgi:hypothetical protein